jgi:hypothetical protein
MSDVQRYLAEKIYNTISKSTFANWYGLNDQDGIDDATDGRFVQHLSDNKYTKEEILCDICELFHL